MYRRLISGILALAMAFQLCSATTYASENAGAAQTVAHEDVSKSEPVAGVSKTELSAESGTEKRTESGNESEAGNAAGTERENDSTEEPETKVETGTERENDSTEEPETKVETGTEHESDNAAESETGAAIGTERESDNTEETETEAETGTEAPAEPPTDDERTSEEDDGEDETDAVEEGEPDYLFQAGGFHVLNEDQGYADEISLFSTGDMDRLADSIYAALTEKETSVSVQEYEFHWDSTEDRQQLLGVYYAVVNDHPELYYVRTGYGVSYQTSSKLITKISPQYFPNIDDEAFQSGVQEAKSVVTEDMDDLQKAIALHEYIVLNCEYDKERLAAKTVPKESYGAYGVLANRIAVCQGYALAYKYLLNEYGIECYIVTSDAMNHAWNIVRIGDALYQVDATWDDPTMDKYGLVSHANMFLSDNKFRENHRDWYVTKGSGIVDIKAEGTAYDSAFWRDVKSPLVRDPSETQTYYYVSGGGELQSRTCTISQIGSEPAVLIGVGTPYSGLALDGTRLYYNTNKNISYIDIGEAREDSTAEYQSQVRFSLSDGDADNIYGFTRNDGIIRYVKRAAYTLSGKSTIYVLDDSKDIVSEAEGNMYTVTFRDDFGTVFDTQTVAEGGYAVPPDNKITFPAGYQLSYWKGNYSNVRKDETVSAVYTKISYKIAYMLNGGTNSSANKATKYDVETDTIILEPPTRENYDFAGWYQDAGYSTPITTIPKGSTGNLTLYAKWTPVVYRITYELNNGTNHPGNPSEYNVETGGIALGEPTREHYDFMGWYADVAYETRVREIEAGSVGNLTLYAKWAPVAYQITYELNGGTNSSANKATKYDVETDTIILEPPTRENYDFAGWYRDAGYGTPIATIPKGSTGNLTLYAKWTPVAYRIIYKLDNGTNHPGNPSEYNVETGGIALGEPTREHYDFMGWYADAAYETRIREIEAGSVGERTLYAKWALRKYTISYELNGGTNSPLNPPAYDVETDDILLENPEREHYDFVGWYADAAYETAVSAIGRGSAGDRTLYAKWALRKYTISYELNGGTNSASNPSAYSGETEDILLEAPTHEDRHYRFEGWYTDSEFTQEISSLKQGSAGDLCLYAKWARYYRVRFYDASNRLVSETEVREGADAKAPDVAAPAGYELQGWDGDYTNVRQDMDIRAVCTLRQYAITYVLRDGVNSPANPSEYTIETDTFPLEEPTPLKEELTFAGWYLDEAYRERVTSVERGSMGDLTLYARWVGVWMDAEGLSEKSYTGNEITSDRITVYNGYDELRPGVDYTISYVNNINAADMTANKAPAVVVTGKGNYQGKYIRTFTISPILMEQASVAEMAVVYKKGKVQKPVPTVVWNGKKLVSNKDFTVSYQESPVDVGEYSVVVTGKGNFAGSVTTTLTITDNTDKIALSSAKIVRRIPAQTYSPGGVTIREDMIALRYGAEELAAGVDYEFVNATYKGAGTHYVTIRAKGDQYIGDITTTFEIQGVKVSGCKAESVIYTGRTAKPVIRDKDGHQLTEGEDYEIISLTGSESVGTAKIRIAGINAYCGTAAKTFKVTACPISDSGIAVSFAKSGTTQPYEKNGAKPKVVLTYDGHTLTEGTDYMLSYKNNKTVGGTATVTITGKKNFNLKRTLTFTVGKGSLQNAAVTVADKVENSKAGGYVSTPVLKDANGNKLVSGRDYDKNIVYRCDGLELNKKADRLFAGAVVTVEITGKGNYEGTRATASYRILAAGTDVSKAKVAVKNKLCYDGGSVTLTPNDLTVKIGKVTLSEGDYEILPETYVNNDRKGTAKVTIRGIGTYGGTKTVSFKINAQKMEK